MLSLTDDCSMEEDAHEAEEHDEGTAAADDSKSAATQSALEAMARHEEQAEREAEADGGDDGVATDRASADRCRLLALLAACRQLTDPECAELARAAELPDAAHLPVSRAFTYMGLPLGRPSASLHPVPPGSSSSDDDVVVPLRRRPPPLQALLRQAIDGQLSEDDFPYVDGDAAEHATADPFDSEELMALRSELVGSWAFRRRERGGGGGGASRRQGLAAKPPKLVVLLLGGASHAELRCAHELGGQALFGCTALLTPLQYLRALREMGKNALAPRADVGMSLRFSM